MKRVLESSNLDNPPQPSAITMTNHTNFCEAHFLIAGVIRDCAHLLDAQIDAFERVFGSSRSVSFYLVESDSIDQTVAALSRRALRQSNFAFHSAGYLRERLKLRAERIAFCRNLYLAEIKSNPKYQAVDYVVIADFDGVNLDLDVPGVMSCWDFNDWDVCCANQAGPYYDVWALRHRDWSPNDCWEQMKFLRKYSDDEFLATLSAVYARMIRIPENSEWIEVESAFGGCAIYKRNALCGSIYCGLTPEGQEVCEHIELHRLIRSKGGRIFINPKFINTGLVEHAGNVFGINLLRFWVRVRRRQVKKILRNLFWKSPGRPPRP